MGRKIALWMLLALVASTFMIASADEGVDNGDDEDKAGAVVVLNDDNFEHLTQAVTGSTTGDWFVKFYIPTCPHCVRMAEAWNEFATAMDSKINVADINCKENTLSCNRFNIRGYPSVLFLRKGKFYKYSGARTVEGFTEFMETYESAKTQGDIPDEPGLFWSFASALQKGVGYVETAMAQNPIQTTILIVIIMAAFTAFAVFLANFIFSRMDEKMKTD